MDVPRSGRRERRRGEGPCWINWRIPPARRSGVCRPSRVRRGRQRGQQRVPFLRSGPQELSHLSLDGLRAYRSALAAEEDQASRTGGASSRRASTPCGWSRARAPSIATALKPVLSSARIGRGRSALVRVVPIDDIPPLPDLERLWESVHDANGPEEQKQLEADLETRGARALRVPAGAAPADRRRPARSSSPVPVEALRSSCLSASARCETGRPARCQHALHNQGVTGILANSSGGLWSIRVRGLAC